MNTVEKLDTSRRRFLKKSAYVAPAIITLKATPVFASHGSLHQVELFNKPDVLPNKNEFLQELNTWLESKRLPE